MTIQQHILLQKLQFEPYPIPFKSEKAFTAWFWKKIHDRWWMWHKISDMSINYKPSDAIIWWEWICWLVEIKLWKEKTKVDIHKLLRKNQIFALERYKKNGGLSIVIYYNQVHHCYWIFEYSEDMKLNLE